MHLITAYIGLSLLPLLASAIPAATTLGQPIPAYLAWTPRPTVGPELRRRLLQPRELFRRQASTRDPWTCGYVNGNPNTAVTCASSSLCVADQVRTAVACCPSLNAKDTECGGGIFTSCVPRTASCDDGCVKDDLILKCTFPLQPACYTYKWENGYVYFGCWSTSFSSAVKLTYTGERLSSFSSNIKQTPSSTPESSITSKEHTSTLPSTTTNAMPPPTYVLTESTPTPTPAPSADHSAAIAGGVVGALAIIAAFILGLLYIRRKKPDSGDKNTNDNRQSFPRPESTAWPSTRSEDKTYYGSPEDVHSPVSSQYTSPGVHPTGIPQGVQAVPPFELDVQGMTPELREATTPAPASPMSARGGQLQERF
ncbi:hypothetical protein K440DRAFT_615486 [Wilcoxina mikolae CBS 423.85]|nr:hypothetical protein K440DRAFT_615486 [Wilcoxina mikolae CBS 423.85]